MFFTIRISVRLMRSMCRFWKRWLRKTGYPSKAVKIRSREDAQNAPTPITTYSLFCDGEYITNEQMNDKKFQAYRWEEMIWHQQKSIWILS